MNANLMTKKIEMSKKEAKAAGKIGTPEFEELKNYMAIYPGFEVQIKAPAKRKVEFRGLTYEYMKNYIKKHDDEDGKKMAQFLSLTGQDEHGKIDGIEVAGYLDVKDWFLDQFPDVANFQNKREEVLAKVQQKQEAARKAKQAAAIQARRAALLAKIA